MTQYLTNLDNFSVHRLAAEDFAKHIPELQEHNIDSNVVRSYIQACDENLKATILFPYTSRDVHKLRSQMIDALLKKLFEQFIINNPHGDLQNVTLIAVGGYGREEMSLYSDIDLLFLYDGQHLDALQPCVEQFLYKLWDAKLDVGHSVRTSADCQKLAESDHTVFTNLLEARYLTGNKQHFVKLQSTMATLLHNATTRDAFIRDKIKERHDRHAKFGGSVYLLEPNLKEGKGGLRDLHMLRWLARAFGWEPHFLSLYQNQIISEEEFLALNFSLRFLLQIRNRLHLMQKKKVDQLNFDYQGRLAESLGFTDSSTGILAVENFMQSYYTIAAQVRQITETAIRKLQHRQQSTIQSFINKLKSKNLDANFKIHDDQIVVKNPGVFASDPYQLMVLFRHVQQTGLDIHFETKETVTKSIHLVNDDFRNNPKISELFCLMMTDLNRLGETLFAMHDVHFFDAYIPEFRKLRNRVQHDIYHVYTVDTHSIFAISELSKLARGDYAGKFDPYFAALSEVKKKDVLSMGLLFHDVGKGEGGNHSVVGAEIARKVATRLGYSEEDQHTIDFLVLSHLMMPHLSQRRDLEDQHLIREFAKTIKTVDRLNMLYVLTWGDIRAVSNEAWTDWKGTLLNRLYDKTKPIFSEQDLSEDYALRRSTDLRESIRSRVQNTIDSEKFDDFLNSISARYLFAHTDAEILEHFHLFTRHDSENYFFQAKDLLATDVTEVLIYTFNNPRVVALVTGVMLAHGVNILDMEIFTLAQGSILVKMRVQTEMKTNLSEVALTDKIEKNLKDVFTGKVKIDDLIAKRKRPSYLAPKKPLQKAESKIDIDNDVSPYFTIIDIYTHDRLGLLYDIIRCLTEQSCYVEVSKISTKVEQVVDSFYVKDIFGHKITSKGKLQEIKKALMRVIEPEIDSSATASASISSTKTAETSL